MFRLFPEVSSSSGFENDSEVSVLRSNRKWDKGWIVEKTTEDGNLVVWKTADDSRLTKTIAKANVHLLVKAKRVNNYEYNSDYYMRLCVYCVSVNAVSSVDAQQ